MKYFNMQCMSCRTILIEILLWKKNFLHMTCRSTDLATRVLAMADLRLSVQGHAAPSSIARNQNSLFEQRSYFSFLHVSVTLWLFIILCKWYHGPFQPMLYKSITYNYNIFQYGRQVYFWWWQSPFCMMVFEILTLSRPTLNQTSVNRASDWLICSFYLLHLLAYNS